MGLFAQENFMEREPEKRPRIVDHGWKKTGLVLAVFFGSGIVIMPAMPPDFRSVGTVIVLAVTAATLLLADSIFENR